MAIRQPAHLILIALAALALPAMAACEQGVPVAAEPDAPTARSQPPAPVDFERETSTFAFTYAYPGPAAALPKLAAMLDAERIKALSDIETQTAEAQKDAADNGYPFNPHMLGVAWKVTGETEQVLAMVAEISSYSGGAHGNTGYEALIWDKATNQRVELAALFNDWGGTLEPLRERYCAALTGERRQKRGADMGEPDDMFNSCPPFSDLVMVPYASDETGFDRMMFIAAPYVAGPYVEGAYEISLPLAGATLDQVKPAYRSAFAIPAR
ncbi:DUF4163 domain-containing protein [Blastomonas sp.]|uniref:DUF4163 domain-containing protein n=1 Tax=Blastomonas sp. TaxID=1909299 RepID=UPI0026333015|nr:DUF4163 domain-containing protein [Blastomonas sp.]MDM7957083.1 DUF4163 domain-containing protein [Blastomonas sp.]